MTDHQLPNNCIHTVLFWLRTYTGQQAEVTPHWATCNLHSRLVPDLSVFDVSKQTVYVRQQMCIWALVPFWRAIIKMGNVLGWGGTLGEGGGIYRSNWDKRISSLLISSSEFVWPFKQNPKSFLCPATPHWSTPAWLWTVPPPPPHFSFLSWTSLKSHWFSFCFFTLPNSLFFAPAVLSTWLFSHVFQWFLISHLPAGTSLQAK